MHQNKCCHLVCRISHPWLFSHAPSSMSNSSSSPTYPTTQREHSVHPAHLQDPTVDKVRHQESLWRKDLQRGGNPRNTTPTDSAGQAADAVSAYTQVKKEDAPRLLHNSKVKMSRCMDKANCSRPIQDPCAGDGRTSAKNIQDETDSPGLSHSVEKADRSKHLRQTEQIDHRARAGQAATQESQVRAENLRHAHRDDFANRLGPGRRQIRQTDPGAEAGPAGRQTVQHDLHAEDKRPFGALRRQCDSSRTRISMIGTTSGESMG